MRWIREALAAIGILCQLGLLWQYWDEIPARVPTHFGFSGQPDAYGAKSTLWLLLALSFGLWTLLTTVNYFPQLFNYPVKVTEQNRERLKLIALEMMGWLKAEITCLLAYIEWTMIRGSLGVSGGLGAAFLPLTLGVVGVTIVTSIVQMRRAP